MDVTNRAPNGVPHKAIRVFEVGTGSAPVIDDALISALHRALDDAIAAPECRILLLTSATPGVFNVGMNVAAAGQAGVGVGGEGEDENEAAAARRTGGAYFDLLERFTLAPLIVAAAVEGRVAGGGVGLVAACDFVAASEAATFGLPEALWGLLPCCVLPFLIRRVGFAKAYSMALTTRPVSAPEAVACGLADEISEHPGTAIRRLALRADKIDTATIAALKAYSQRLWPLPDDVRDLAVDELGRLMTLPAVRGRMAAFATGGRFPWEG